MDQYNNNYGTTGIESYPLAQNHNLNQDQYPQTGQYQTQQNGFLAADDMDEGFKSLSDRTRHDFVKKVYFTLSCQLLINALEIYLAFSIKPLKEFMINNQWVLWITIVFTLVFQYTLIYGRKLARTFPTNILLL